MLRPSVVDRAQHAIRRCVHEMLSKPLGRNGILAVGGVVVALLHLAPIDELRQEVGWVQGVWHKANLHLFALDALSYAPEPDLTARSCV